MEGDDSVHKKGQRRHPHRHHHGEGARAAMWLANERSIAEHTEGRAPHEGDTSEGTRHKSMSPPLYVAESGVEDGNRVRHNDVHPESIQGEDHMPSLPEILEEAGISLKPSLLKTKTTNVRRGSSEEGRKRNGRKNKRNRTAKRNRNNRLKRKNQKGCRRLRGANRRKCLNALRQCRSLKKRKKKKCRADALQAALNEVSGVREETDIFSFLKNITESKCSYPNCATTHVFSSLFYHDIF